MKKLIIFLVVFLLTVSGLLSQNSIDPKNFRDYTDIIIEFDNTGIFAKNWNNIKIGWNYGGPGRQLDSLMKTNYHLHSWYNNSTINFAQQGDNHKWYLTVTPLNASSSADKATDQGVVGTQSIYYEPTIDVVRDDSFTPNSNNTQGAVFGFQNQHSSLSYSGGSVVMLPFSSTSLPVLSDVWPKNELKFWNKLIDDVPWGYDTFRYGDGDLRDGFNGRELYLSVNLKSRSTPINEQILDIPVITLKVKYWYTDHSNNTHGISYIKFNNSSRGFIVPITGSLNDNRGKTRNDIPLPNPTTEFVITPRMLITQEPNTANEEITLSANFNCYYGFGINPFDSINEFNPYLRTLDGTRSNPPELYCD